MLKSAFRSVCQQYLISPETTEWLMQTARLDPEQVRALCQEKGCKEDYLFMIRDGVLWLSEPIADVEPFAFLGDLARILDAALTEFYEDADTDLDYEDWLSVVPPVELTCEGNYWIAHIEGWQIWVLCNDLTYTVMTKMTTEGYCRPDCQCERCQQVREIRALEGVAQ
jgi:hypothetical protein